VRFFYLVCIAVKPILVDHLIGSEYQRFIPMVAWCEMVIMVRAPERFVLYYFQNALSRHLQLHVLVYNVRWVT